MSKCGVAKGWMDDSPMVDIYRDGGIYFVAATDLVNQLNLTPPKEHTAITREMVGAPPGSIYEFSGKRKGITLCGLEYLRTRFHADESVTSWIEDELIAGLKELYATTTPRKRKMEEDEEATPAKKQHRAAAAAAAAASSDDDDMPSIETPGDRALLQVKVIKDVLRSTMPMETKWAIITQLFK